MRGIRVVILAALPFVLLAQPRIDPDEVKVGWSMYVPPSQYVFRAETNLVEVGVVVRDRQGRAVAGLGKADFEIWE